MDLAYLRAHPEQVPTFLTHQRIRETPVTGGSICSARRLTLDDGASVFVKSFDGTAKVGAGVRPEHFFESEAAGLRWLGEAGAVPVPEVIAALPELLILDWVDDAAPSIPAAERFGRALARLHRAGAAGFGAPWPGFIGLLPQDNGPGWSTDPTEPTADDHGERRNAARSADPTPGTGGDAAGPAGDGTVRAEDGRSEAWPQWFAGRRLEPYLRLATDRNALSLSDATTVTAVLDRIDAFGQGAEAPARLHGDLWPGNLLWTDEAVMLIDPAAHGGHRETDLAQLALFGGAPYLDRIVAAYDEVWPLSTGWAERVPLHQLQLLLVHAALFGGSYREAVLAAARAALRAA